VQKFYTNRATSYKALIVKAYGMFYYSSSLRVASLYLQVVTVYVHLVQESFRDLRTDGRIWRLYWWCMNASACVWRAIWSGFACASVFALKVTRTWTHYKFLLVWTLWTVACISVDTLCGLNGRYCRRYAEMKDIYLFAAASCAHTDVVVSSHPLDCPA
jgi:hypothetical protein